MAASTPGSRLYRPRRPERTLLYRALADQFERFLLVYEDRFERTHGSFRRSVEKAVYRYLDCGIFIHGAARALGAERGHDALIAFSCKLRCRCPSCDQKHELLGVEWASEVRTEVPHRQGVSTVPKRLRVSFRFDRKLLYCLPHSSQRMAPPAPRRPSSTATVTLPQLVSKPVAGTGVGGSGGSGPAGSGHRFGRQPRKGVG